MAPFRFPRVKYSLFAQEGCAHVTHTTDPLLRSLLQQNPAPAHSPSLLPIFPPRVGILSRTGRPNRCACARPFPLASTSGAGGGAGFSRRFSLPKRWKIWRLRTTPAAGCMARRRPGTCWPGTVKKKKEGSCPETPLRPASYSRGGTSGCPRDSSGPLNAQSEAAAITITTRLERGATAPR